uniref:COP9 signalosome complex subunit 7 isoform X2 n=1 Tax=Rhizophora mucronata TaxID=61149 RepID=A0A2P2LU47_RHIMU
MGKHQKHNDRKSHSQVLLQPCKTFSRSIKFGTVLANSTGITIGSRHGDNSQIKKSKVTMPEACIIVPKADVTFWLPCREKKLWQVASTAILQAT